MAKVGFIGLGIMGRPMAHNLLKAGAELMVNDTQPAAVEELVAAGAESGSYAEIGRCCDVVITILPSGPIVQQVLFGPGGVSEGLSEGKLVCDMSSVTPVESRLCAEKLAGIDVTPRCKALRVICCELSRIASHLIGIAAYGMDAGSWTVFMYCYTQREKLYTLFEQLTGARLTTSFARVGGMRRDIPEGWLGAVNAFANQFLPALDEIDALITRNKIFMDRAVGIGVISAEEAMQWGLTGANLRASGVASDLRKDVPYLGYEDYDFDVAIGVNGDCYDRWLVRIEEMRQSIRIVRQAIEKMPDGPVCIDNPHITPPEKTKVLKYMENLINNFIITTNCIS